MKQNQIKEKKSKKKKNPNKMNKKQTRIIEFKGDEFQHQQARAVLHCRSDKNVEV
jgi:hypothetical protein